MADQHRSRASVIVALAAAGCATYAPPTATYDFDPVAVFSDASYDEVWDAVIDVFGEQSWPIDQFEKASGIITTDWLRAPAGWADCGKVEDPVTPDIDFITEQEVRFNIVVRYREGVATMRANTVHRASALVDGNRVDAECISNGSVEAFLHDLVRSSLR